MYSPASPVLSSLDHHHSGSVTSGGYLHHHHQQQHHHHLQQAQQQQQGQCLKFKYFTTFLVSTTCLALLSASLATHKWIISKPIRILKLNGGQTNFTSLMLTAQSDEQFDGEGLIGGNKPIRARRHSYDAPSYTQSATNNHLVRSAIGRSRHQFLPSPLHQLSSLGAGSPSGGDQLIEQHPAILNQHYSHYSSQNNKFQGEIYFGLFKGVKVLNYGFGDRVSPISG